jgi:hypothetical protein
MIVIKTTVVLLNTIVEFVCQYIPAQIAMVSTSSTSGTLLLLVAAPVLGTLFLFINTWAGFRRGRNPELNEDAPGPLFNLSRSLRLVLGLPCGELVI